MATFKYFSGDVELIAPHGLPNKEFAATFPGITGRRFDGYDMLVGHPKDETPAWDSLKQKWLRTVLPVERVIQFKDRPSLHECDDRCMHATGRTMKCECSCGGKNHGKGAVHG